MTQKIYKFTEKQLHEFANTLVENTIRQFDNVEIIDEQIDESTSIESGDFSPEQYDEAMRVMAANRGAGDEPKVGIFWYNVAHKKLFGVITHKRTDYLKPNAGGGLITCSEMHEDVWKKEFYKQKYHNNGKGFFIGQYQDKPRGRVFYSPQDDQYIIAVGSWIDDHKEAIDMIIEEFDLPKDKTITKKAPHWDIGQTWK
jgi:hypothetical protein